MFVHAESIADLLRVKATPFGMVIGENGATADAWPLFRQMFLKGSGDGSESKAAVERLQVADLHLACCFLPG